ncbi:MAG: alkaline phosphatase family protein [Pseudonocardiales bacterium]|nr:alkaline phosphatase family protein [Pseudonocardiales bacterium]MBV9032294.1 alkaline phosphatase family protein [Pseudonocardiales bacterium]MBW0009552.1 alkaline phosphatase family protein [Pseudonocardiales bacterium]
MDAPLVPGAGQASLADVVPALLSALGVAGFTDRLGLNPARGVCLLLVDGLGWRSLREHPGDAPFLMSLTEGSEPITAGFPATTATSVAAIGTGVPAGRHGIVGYTFATPEGDLINALSWHTHGGGERVDLRERFVPEDIQPRPTALERAAAAGVRVTQAVPHVHRDSGLNRVALRGADFQGVHALGDLAASALTAVSGGGRSLCYAYHGDLDLLGHVYGVGSLPWRLQLAHVDRLAAGIAEGLPSGAHLVVIADHGMVTVPEEGRLDFDTEPALRAGVRLLGGDPRARYVYTEPGATDDVLAAWEELIGDRAWIRTRDEAIAAGWFGPVVEHRIRDRIGDLIVAARTDFAVVRSRVSPTLSRLIGHHGSLTPDEQLVPLLVYRPDSD